MKSLCAVRGLAALLMVSLLACVPPVVEVDGGHDAGIADAGVDAGTNEDAGVADAGDLDAGLPDAGDSDAGAVDAGTADAGDVDAGVSDAGAAGCPVPTGGAPFTLRVMAANLTSGNLQSYDPGEGGRIMTGAQPDIVLIQEFKYGSQSDDDLSAFVLNTLGPDFGWYRGTGSIPNGIISRYPILEAGEWNGLAPDRELTWAKLDVPGGGLLAISVHLLTSNASDRNADALTIMQQLDAGTSPYAYVVIGGDFNTNTRSESVFTTLSPRFNVAAPYPVDQLNNGNTSADRNRPYDHVLASNCLAARQVPTVIGSNQFDAGLVVDTRVYTPITDLSPAFSTDSAATNMQHMGVVKDFLIQP